MDTAFEVQIVPSALEELKEIKVFYQRRIVDAIDQQLAQQPTSRRGTARCWR